MKIDNYPMEDIMQNMNSRDMAEAARAVTAILAYGDSVLEKKEMRNVRI